MGGLQVSRLEREELRWGGGNMMVGREFRRGTRNWGTFEMCAETQYSRNILASMKMILMRTRS